VQVATTLFSLPAVDGLYFGPDFITVTHTRTAASSAALAWQGGLRDEIVAYLQGFCEEQQGQQDAKEAARLDASSHFDDPTEALIVDIIETQVAAQLRAVAVSVPLTRYRCVQWCRRTAAT
jgi:hypothetical protein